METARRYLEQRPEGDTIFADKEMAGEDADAPYGLWGTLAWFGGLIVATYFLGFILALAAFIPIVGFFVPVLLGLAFVHYLLTALRSLREAGG